MKTGNVTDLSDKVLLKGFQAGNDGYFTLITKKYYAAVLRNIEIKSKDADLAQDIVQDAFLKAMDRLKRPTHNNEGSLLGWFNQVATNLFIDHLRKQETRGGIMWSFSDNTPQFPDTGDDELFCDEYGFFTPGRDVEIMQKQGRDDLRHLIHLLPSEQKEVVLMRHYAGLTFNDIAVASGLSINTVIGRMRYALNKLRKLMADVDQQNSYELRHAS